VSSANLMMFVARWRADGFLFEWASKKFKVNNDGNHQVL
jgi:hypothetical protein